MPLFEFVCNNCKDHFEMLVIDDSKVECPKCKNIDITKQFSTFSAKSQNNSCSSRDLCQNMQGAKHKCCGGCCHH
ncbi:MAG: zinc ribbon domain-containing protein [Endomicrobium sp.]|jgi:putative FmdB family regulatory protein|nr:zinc ribbon domain-containing protein [Endomicrobium sp.]